MARKSVTKPGATPASKLQYNETAPCGFRRLPFVGKKSAWDVPATGGYQGGCEAGKWAAIAYLKMLRAEQDVGPGYLQCIVLDMLKRNQDADTDAFRGQAVGFFSTLDYALHTAAKLDERLDAYRERDLADAMTRAVNFDEETWMTALQKLQDVGGESVPFFCFHAYRHAETSADTQAA